jgi:hypothetical protein
VGSRKDLSWGFVGLWIKVYKIGIRGKTTIGHAKLAYVRKVNRKKGK